MKLKAESKNKKNSFFKSFGAFSDEKSSDEIIAEIKSSRRFRKKLNHDEIFNYNTFPSFQYFHGV